MTRFDISRSRLEEILSLALSAPTRILAATPLGESSRKTPWRIDVNVDGTPSSCVLRYGDGCSRNEAIALAGMETHPIPTPHLIHWDEHDEILETPIFVSEFIHGEALLPAMKAKEAWAIDLYVETACALQAIRAEDLSGDAGQRLEVGESARDVLDAACAAFPSRDVLIEEAYARLNATEPELPGTQFSNGDLWPENLIVRDRALVGVIDWQHAGFSDPVFEFLLPFFLVPSLRGLGIEERYCRRKGIDPAALQWYRGLEIFDSLRWVEKTGEPYEIHTAGSLRRDLAAWLDGATTSSEDSANDAGV